MWLIEYRHRDHAVGSRGISARPVLVGAANQKIDPEGRHAIGMVKLSAIQVG